jgi:hypothetical protein
MPSTRLSACSSHPLKLLGKARPASPPNSAKWSNCRRRRTRSSSATKSTISGPATQTCRLPRSKPIKQRWAAHRAWWPRMPASTRNEAAAKGKRVKRVCIPNRSTKSPERKREQKKRWFRNGQKWRTGCEGRISVVKRRHRLDRSRCKGDAGIKRWVGLTICHRQREADRTMPPDRVSRLAYDLGAVHSAPKSNCSVFYLIACNTFGDRPIAIKVSAVRSAAQLEYRDCFAPLAMTGMSPASPGHRPTIGGSARRGPLERPQ